MSGFPATLEKRLGALDRDSLRRSIRTRSGKDFCSNDYLGFAQDPILQQRFRERLADAPVGSTGSRLLRGHTDLHAQAETKLAALAGREAALLFGSGYQANIALLSSLAGPDDIIFSDELNHASLIDGARLSRAEKVIYPHKSLQALRTSLSERAGRPGLKIIVTESIFSMDGDTAPLKELAALASEFSALLIVDEAHAVGLFGETGGGLAQSLGLQENLFASIHTGGKALGCGGAWIACDGKLKEYLVNFARPFIYSTAPMPALACGLLAAAEYWKETGPARAGEVLKRCTEFKKRLPRTTDVTGPIFPVVIGDNAAAIRISEQLRENGFDVRAIRPPTVPDGTARLRVTVTWPVSPDDLRRFSETLSSLLENSR